MDIYIYILLTMSCVNIIQRADITENNLPEISGASFYFILFSFFFSFKFVCQNTYTYNI